MFDEIINLTSYVNDARDGQFENESEIRKEFRTLRKLLKKYESDTLKTFHEHSKCEHEMLPKEANWRFGIFRNTIVRTFTSECVKCGKQEYITTQNDETIPEGFKNIELRDHTIW